MLITKVNYNILLFEALLSRNMLKPQESQQKLYVYPPNFQKCQQHCQATRIWKGITQNTNNDQCECCERRLGQQQVKFQCCYSPQQLAFLGPGVPLFFVFLRNCIILIIIMSIVFAGFGIYSNLIGGSCESSGKCQASIFNTLSIVNKATVSDYMSIQNYICLVFVVICIFVFHGFRYNFRKVQEDCDDFVDSPSDYTIMLRRLPQNCQVSDIQKMVEARRGYLSQQERQKTQNLKVQQILLSYRLGEYTMVKEKNIQEFKRYVKEDKKQAFVPQNLPEPKQTATLAIIVFSRQESKDFFIYQPNICQNILECLCNPCVPLSDEIVKDQKVSVQRAPQPDDIIWQNAGISVSGGIIRKSWYNLVALLMLAIGAGVQYGLAVAQNSFTDEDAVFIMGIISSVIVAVLNVIIQVLIQFTTARQRNQTQTEYNTILTVKIGLFQFLNTGVIVVFSNLLADISNFSIQAGLSAEVTQIMILNAVTSNASAFILYFFNIIGRVKRLLIKKELIIASQLQANKAFQLQAAELPYKYSYVLKTIWLTAFYAPLVPIVVPISVGGLFLNYWIEKCLFGGSYKVPNMMSSMINEVAIELMEYFPLILAIGQFLVYFYFKNFNFTNVPQNWSIPIYIALAVSFVNLILPMDKINRRLFKLKVDNISNPSYQQVQQKFEVTYEMTNPAYHSKRKRKRDKIFINFLLGHGQAIQLGNMMAGLNTNQIDKSPLLNQANQSFQRIFKTKRLRIHSQLQVEQ